MAGLAACAIGFALAIRLALVTGTSFIAWFTGSPRPAEHRIGPAGTLRLVLGEWRAMLADNFLYLPFEAIALRADAKATPSANLPVILVHGYFSNRGMLRAVVRALDAAGIQPVFTLNFRGIFTPIDALALQLEEVVERVLAGTGQARAILVCHSMGGLIARAWMARGGAARVAKLITVASPHHGTALAKLGLGANVAQMQRGSAFLEDLRRREGDQGPGIAATSIYSPHDNLVAPHDTSRLPWAKNVALPGLGHIDILLSARLHRILVEELREASQRRASTSSA
jgi:pimeloyl-ACP methyl ester carboxylesterase